MKTSHTSRLLTAVVAIFSMLFMQLAVASYACPEVSPGSHGNVSSSSSPAAMEMAGCEDMDLEQPTLCHTNAHGESAKQSQDKSPFPDVPPFVPAELLLTLQAVDFALPARQNYSHIALKRTSSPPIAIRNCCFRI